MAITLIAPRATKNEQDMQKSLLLHYDWRQNACFWNTYLADWESDFLCVSKAGYVTEVEVKVSWGDWMQDQTKDKWKPTPHNTKQWLKFKNFCYAVPHPMYEKRGIPEWVPETVGIITVEAREFKTTKVREIRKPTAIPGALALDQQGLVRLYRSHYFRSTQKFLSRSI